MTACKPAQISAVITMPQHRQRLSQNIRVGKDVLELLTGAMYVDPLTIYREYIQNAADAIDQARIVGLFDGKIEPRIEITLDQNLRTVRIRDNGEGVPGAEFASRLSAIGASKKQGKRQRGFRGVGRLSGLGYAQEVTFRTRYFGETLIHEMVWNGRRLRELLRNPAYQGDLASAISEVAEVSSKPADNEPPHFFEVELRHVTRVKNDLLMNPEEIRAYLSQVGPVPISPAFAFRDQIEEYLRYHGIDSSIQILLTGEEVPIYRPFKDSFEITKNIRDSFNGIEFIEIPGIEGSKDAVGWILHHSYYGALPRRSGLSGIRLRSGNIQVGGHNTLDGFFSEQRFNSWCVGELHVLSEKIIPNGRRDDFELNAHCQNLHGHAAVMLARLSKTCRGKSILRNRLRKAHAMVTVASDALGLLKGSNKHDFLVEIVIARVTKICQELKRLSEVDTLNASEKALIVSQITALESKMRRATRISRRASVFKSMHATKRVAYEHVLRLIYELSPALREAHDLSERILKAIRKDLATRDS